MKALLLICRHPPSASCPLKCMSFLHAKYIYFIPIAPKVLAHSRIMSKVQSFFQISSQSDMDEALLEAELLSSYESVKPGRVLLPQYSGRRGKKIDIPVPKGRNEEGRRDELPGKLSEILKPENNPCWLLALLLVLPLWLPGTVILPATAIPPFQKPPCCWSHPQGSG